MEIKIHLFSAKQAMEAGTNPVIIDNTNSQAWEMKIYVTFVSFPII